MVGLPSPITGSPHKEPEKPRAPRLRGFFFIYFGLSTAGTLEPLAFAGARIDLGCQCASASPPGTSTRSDSKSIWWAVSPGPIGRTSSACKRSNASRASFPSSSSARSAFPHIAVAGQKGYHGVAILSRLPFTLDERRDICGRGHARHLSVTPRRRKADRAAQHLRAGGRRRSRSRAQREIPP